MNWKDAATDAAIAKGKTALNAADRAAGFMAAQDIVMKEHLWIPVMNPRMYQTTTKKVKGARAHMLFQYTFYKGLDTSP
jgi:peptide/nickel transport system substrate-binding protein